MGKTEEFQLPISCHQMNFWTILYSNVLLCKRVPWRYPNNSGCWSNNRLFFTNWLISPSANNNTIQQTRRCLCRTLNPMLSFIGEGICRRPKENIYTNPAKKPLIRNTALCANYARTWVIKNKRLNNPDTLGKIKYYWYFLKVVMKWFLMTFCLTHVSALFIFSPHQRCFLLQQMGTNAEIHSQTLHRNVMEYTFGYICNIHLYVMERPWNIKL